MSHTKIQNRLFLVLLVMFLVCMCYVIRSYLFPIFWAIVFAILLCPIVNSLQAKYKITRGKLTLMAMLSFVVLLLVPFVLAGKVVVTEGIELQQTYFAGNFEEEIQGFTKSIENMIGIEEGKIAGKLAEIVGGMSKVIVGSVVSWGQNIVHLGFSFFIALYVTYFFIVYESTLKRRVIKLLPLGDDREKELINRFSTTTRATIKGTVVIMLALAVVSFVLFSLLGIKGAALWAAVLGLSSIVPLFGTAIVWFPMAMSFIFFGSITKAIIILLFGSLVISNLDNILRPIIVGKDTGLPEVVVLLATLGGLATFGLSGLILGPVLASLVWVMVEMYEKEYNEILSVED